MVTYAFVVGDLYIKCVCYLCVCVFQIQHTLPVETPALLSLEIKTTVKAIRCDWIPSFQQLFLRIQNKKSWKNLFTYVSSVCYYSSLFLDTAYREDNQYYCVKHHSAESLLSNYTFTLVVMVSSSGPH